MIYGLFSLFFNAIYETTKKYYSFCLKSTVKSKIQILGDNI